MKRWLIFLGLITSSTCLPAQLKLKRDTAFIQPRSFDNNALRELKSKKEFQYNKYQEPAPSLWDKFWNWVWWKIDQLLRTRSGRVTIWSILIMLAIAVVIYFAIKVTGMDRDGLFGRGSKGLQKYTLSQDDIHQISFDSAIETAINNGNYRLAIRLQYLKALKILSDKGYIDWRINKTNTDYLSEITGRPFDEMFSRLTFDFEYTWYGGKQVSREQFMEISQQFQQFNNQVQ